MSQATSLSSTVTRCFVYISSTGCCTHKWSRVALLYFCRRYWTERWIRNEYNGLKRPNGDLRRTESKGNMKIFEFSKIVRKKYHWLFRTIRFHFDCTVMPEYTWLWWKKYDRQQIETGHIHLESSCSYLTKTSSPDSSPLVSGSDVSTIENQIAGDLNSIRLSAQLYALNWQFESRKLRIFEISEREMTN